MYYSPFQFRWAHLAPIIWNNGIFEIGVKAPRESYKLRKREEPGSIWIRASFTLNVSFELGALNHQGSERQLLLKQEIGQGPDMNAFRHTAIQGTSFILPGVSGKDHLHQLIDRASLTVLHNAVNQRKNDWNET